MIALSIGRNGGILPICMYHTGFESVHKLANPVAKKAKLNLGQQRRVQANRERRLQKEHTTVVDDTLFGPAIEGVVISRFGQHYFSYCFKKYTGMSPNVCRRNYEENKE
jgi:hypothetical protein